MGDKDLENIISSIGSQEMASAQKQAQIDRLKQLIKKQKNEMEEQQKLIEELQNKVGNMFDLPADIEELKRMIGGMRADINAKDQQIEMAYGKTAELEAELKNTKIQMAPLSRNLDTYIEQVGELKAKLIEQSSIIKLKDKEITSLQMENESTSENLEKMEEEFALRVQSKLKQFMDTEDQYQERIKKMEADFEERTKQIQSEYNEKADQVQGSAQNNFENLRKMNADLQQKLRNLETELIDKNYLVEEAKHNVEMAEKQSSDIKKKFEEVMEKYTIMSKEHALMVEKINNYDKKNAGLIEFKQKNEGIALNMQGLLTLFEQEPLFKTYLLVKDVGVMDLKILKNTLGIPKVTVKKYIEQFIMADLFDMEGEKISLRHPFAS